MLTLVLLQMMMAVTVVMVMAMLVVIAMVADGGDEGVGDFSMVMILTLVKGDHGDGDKLWRLDDDGDGDGYVEDDRIAAD